MSHITTLEGPDVAGHWEVTCPCGFDSTGLEPYEVVVRALRHGPIAVDSPRPVLETEEERADAQDALVRQALAEVLEIVASVSAANLADRGDSLAATKVDPFAVRRLADLVEEIVPGAVAKVREDQQRRASAAREKYDALMREEYARREAQHRVNAEVGYVPPRLAT